MDVFFMDLEKAYERVDIEALWQVLKMYGVWETLLKGYKVFTVILEHVRGECKCGLKTRLCDVI